MNTPWRSVWGLLAVGWICAVAMGASPPKFAVPDDEALAEARKQVREVMADAYETRDRAGREALAWRLIEASGEESDATLRFAMLDEGIAAAMQAGAVEPALAAFEQMQTYYQHPALDERLELVVQVGRTVRDPEDAASLTKLGLSTLDDLIRVERFDDGMKLATALRQCAGKVKVTALQDAVREQTKRVVVVRSESQRVRSARQALEQTPNDPAANEIVGRYFAFHLDDWQRAWPHLKAGSSRELKSLAQKEQSDPTKVDKQIELGDAWWSYGESVDASEAEHAFERARHWYSVAWPQVTGLAREGLATKLNSGGGATTWSDRAIEPGVAVTWYKYSPKERDRFQHQVYRSVEPQINWLWKQGTPDHRLGNDYFALIAQGYLRYSQPGHVWMRLRVSDRAELWINGQYVAQVTGTATFSTYLIEGYNHFNLHYYENLNQASLQWTWSDDPEGKFEPIPPSAFFHDPDERD